MKTFRGIALAAIVAITLAGCSLQTQESITPGYDSGTSSGKSSSTGAPDSLVTGDIASGDRSVIKTGSISLEVKEIGTVKSELTQLAASHQGLIENWSQESNNAGELWSVAATVRVPAAELEKTIEEISALGDVRTSNVNSNDVTTQVLDIDARVASLTASVARLQKLMAEAKSTADLLAAETALSQRQAELESLQSQQKYLKDAVSMSTLYVSAYAEGRGPIAAPTSFIDGIQEGWRALIAFFTGTIVALGIITPWLLIVAPVGAVVFVIARRIIVKRKKN